MEKLPLLRLGSFEEGYLDKKYEKIDDYRLLKILGMGSNARVYLGYKESDPSQQFAIKFINRSSEYSVEESRQNIVKEGRLLQTLKHPNIIKAFKLEENGSATTTDGEVLPHKILYCVLQLAENGSLEDFLFYHGPFTEELARFYFKQMISGISYLHQNGIVHRDIKAENLLFDSHFNLLISDFGHSAHFRNETGNQLLSESCGTPAYNPPEVGKGEYQGEPLDIFLAGVVLFRMLTGGISPFKKRANDNDGFYKFLHRDEPDVDSYWRLQELNTGVTFDPDLRDFLSAMMYYKQDKRLNEEQLIQHPWFLRPTPKPEEAFVQMEAKKLEIIRQDELQEEKAIAEDSAVPLSPEISSSFLQVPISVKEKKEIIHFLKATHPDAEETISSMKFEEEPPQQIKLGLTAISKRYSALPPDDHLRAATVVAFNLADNSDHKVTTNYSLHEVDYHQQDRIENLYQRRAN